jgi:hypothetical protein
LRLAYAAADIGHKALPSTTTGDIVHFVSFSRYAQDLLPRALCRPFFAMQDSNWNNFYEAQRHIAAQNKQSKTGQERDALATTWKKCIEKAAACGIAPEKAELCMVGTPSRQALDQLSTPEWRVVCERLPRNPFDQYESWLGQDDPTHRMRLVRPGSWASWDRLWDRLFY